MPTIELLAEIEALKKQVEGYKTLVKYMDEKNRELCQLWSGIAREKTRAEFASHMAALWKRAAKKAYNIEWSLLETRNYTIATKALNELAALKKDARIVISGDFLTVCYDGCDCDTCSAIDRFIEATKEEP
jgi:hypothetical protein